LARHRPARAWIMVCIFDVTESRSFTVTVFVFLEGKILKERRRAPTPAQGPWLETLSTGDPPQTRLARNRPSGCLVVCVWRRLPRRLGPGRCLGACRCCQSFKLANYAGIFPFFKTTKGTKGEGNKGVTEGISRALRTPHNSSICSSHAHRSGVCLSGSVN
jgi:hypothetical protein